MSYEPAARDLQEAPELSADDAVAAEKRGFSGRSRALWGALASTLVLAAVGCLVAAESRRRETAAVTDAGAAGAAGAVTLDSLGEKLVAAAADKVKAIGFCGESAGLSAGDYTCEGRMAWVMEQEQKAAADAAKAVAAKFPQCQPCVAGVAAGNSASSVQVDDTLQRAGGFLGGPQFNNGGFGQSGGFGFGQQNSGGSTCQRESDITCWMSGCNPEWFTCEFVSMQKKCVCREGCWVNGVCAPAVMGDLNCQKHTGGTCGLSQCSSWRRAQCENFLCMCGKNYCSDLEGRCRYSITQAMGFR